MTIRPPKVSVAIPVYNGEAYLAETIASVLAQSFTDFELVICDDHSTDRSAAIAASFADSRIRLLANETNLGFGGNWNRCLAEARGDYIKLLPQDDLIAPACLAKQAAVLEQDAAHALSLTFCARAIIGPDGRLRMRRGLGGRTLRLTGHDVARRTAWKGTNPVGEPGAVLFRASAARAAGAFDGTLPFVIDIDYWLRLLRHGDAAYDPAVLASFRVSRGSQSVRMARRQAAEFTAFLGRLRAGGHYPLSPAQVRMGGWAASLNATARTVVYRLAMRADA